ncbi:RES family NAD+ phosphorylase [Tersicoccus sp. MR15.9]|uniref:RES family NAD+ phosphorylase n=1 Tax=Tersicoccus mangrovi TaxID=3121635 RepID=UPI002FE5212E
MTGAGGVPAPPDPFEPRIDVLTAGSRLIRVFSTGADRTAATFNPGFGAPTRFAFFGDPPVPVLYAGGTEEAAVAETVLHDIPVDGGDVYPEDYRDLAAAALVTGRDLRLAAFHGLGLRRLNVTAGQLTDTSSAHYPDTVAWARAAHAYRDDDGSLDGICWTSRQCNSAKAYVLFGDRVGSDDLEVAVDYARILGVGADLDWLIDLCAGMRINVVV